MALRFTDNLEQALECLKEKGAFLTVKNEETRNTMTIGWANIGYEWFRPIFTVLVRKSRYTYTVIEKSDEFTVSIPIDDSMKEAINFCGTKSGREMDKYKACGLKLKNGQVTNTPVIDGCGIYYECKIVYKQEINPAFLSEDIKKVYGDNNPDYHTLYYGEIVACYKK